MTKQDFKLTISRFAPLFGKHVSTQLRADLSEKLMKFTAVMRDRKFRSHLRNLTFLMKLSSYLDKPRTVIGTVLVMAEENLPHLGEFLVEIIRDYTENRMVSMLSKSFMIKVSRT